MGIAFFTFGSMLAPLHGLAAWFASRSRGAASAPCPRAGHPSTARACAARPAAAGGCDKARRPLRVVRVLDGAGAPATAGRMFMSGRMADVCAELDRLAALEAAAG